MTDHADPVGWGAANRNPRKVKQSKEYMHFELIQ